MRNDKKQDRIKFEDIKEKILMELDKRFKDMEINEPVTLVDGFVNQPVYMELSDSFVIGEPTIPMVMLLGNQSGRIYFFAFNAILEGIQIA
jgi:hypothetical protein